MLFFKNNLKKIVLSLFFLISLVGIIVVVYTIYIVKTVDAVVFKDDLVCVYKDNVYISDFIKKIDGKLMDDYLIDTSNVGRYKKIIRVKNKYGFVEKISFYVKVIDNVAPIIDVSGSVSVDVGKYASIEDFINIYDDITDNLEINIYGDYNLDEVGTYNIKIEAKDNYDNITEKDVVLIVKEVVSSKGNVVSKNNTYNDNGIKFDSIKNKYKDKKIGIDISKWQGDVDFKLLKEAGVKFIMIKIGGEVSMNGEMIIDPKFYDNIEKAINEGFDVGIYYFSKANTVNYAIREARWVHNIIKNYDITMPIVFDWENFSGFTNYHVSTRTLNMIANAFMDELKKYNYDTVLYSSKYYLDNYWDRDNYKIWLAHYNSEYTYDIDVYMWQMCDTGRVSGINEYVDIDLLFN